jgi:hypothetical protein
MSEPSQPTPPGAPVPPSEPTAPPAPPAPPVPPVAPVPQYGEYAPAGYVPPAAVPQQPAPGYEAAANHSQPYGAASYPAQPGARQRKTWDLVLTVSLFVVGFFGMLIGAGYGALLTDPAFLDQAVQGAGIDEFTGQVGAAPAILVISHVLLYLLALGGGLPLLITKRVAFWVPLAAGVIAAIIFWVTLTGVFLTDPGFVAQYS